MILQHTKPTKRDLEKLTRYLQDKGGVNMIERIEVPIREIAQETMTMEEEKSKRQRKTKTTTGEKRKRASKGRGKILKLGKSKRVIRGIELEEVLNERLPRLIIQYAKSEIRTNPEKAKLKIGAVIKALSGPDGIKLGSQRFVLDLRSIKKGFKEYIKNKKLDDADEESKKVALILLFTSLAGKDSHKLSYTDLVKRILNKFGVELSNYNIKPSEVYEYVKKGLESRFATNRKTKQELKEAKNMKKERRRVVAQTLKEELGIKSYVDEPLEIDFEDLIEEIEDETSNQVDNYIREISDFVRGQGLPYDMINAFLTGLITVATIWTSTKLTEFVRETFIQKFVPGLSTRTSNTVTSILIGIGLYNINRILKWMKFQTELPPAVLTAFKIAGGIQIANGVWNMMTGRSILEITHQIDEYISNIVDSIVNQKKEALEEYSQEYNVSSDTELSSDFTIVPAGEETKVNSDISSNDEFRIVSAQFQEDVYSIVDLERKNNLSISEAKKDKQDEVDILSYL